MHIHMVGIGGIGMSALAQLYHHRGEMVVGSDRGTSPVTDLLARKGITVYEGHDAQHVGNAVELLVYSDAVPGDNPERVCARARGVKELSYFEALGEATQNGTSIVVTGTHGKTTTTAMLAKILLDAGREPTVLAGSILSEQGSNYIHGRSDLFVIEGCEYRRHFLHLHPTILVITNIEVDHTDYYKDLQDVQDAFSSVVQRLPEDGALIADTTDPVVRPVLAQCGVSKVPYQEVTVPTLKVPGTFNSMNACAAKAAAYALFPELHEEAIDASLAEFRGTWRRFEYKGTTREGAEVYDDYAHHPTAVAGTLTAMRELWPQKNIVVLFHPHLYSRTRDFLVPFAEALAQADEVLLAPIYAAREKPIPSITSEVLADNISALGTPAHAYTSLDALRNHLQSGHFDLTADTVLITMGAGNIYTIADCLVQNTEA